MIATDYAILIIMGVSAILAALSFSKITAYLFARGLADPRAVTPDIRAFYTAYRAHTRKTGGRVGTAFWIHSISAGLFIATGVVYTIVRFVIPRIL